MVGFYRIACQFKPCHSYRMPDDERKERRREPSAAEIAWALAHEFRRMANAGDGITDCQVQDLKALQIRASKIERKITRLAGAFAHLDDATASH